MEGDFHHMLGLSIEKRRRRSIIIQVLIRLTLAIDFDNMIVSSYGIRKVAISTEVPYADM